MNTEHVDQEVAHQALLNLAVELEARRFQVRLREIEDRPLSITVINTAAPILIESVLTAPHTDGTLWYWFPWLAPISPVDNVGLAADRVERVLAEIGRPTS
ncbi:hypothetical protein [Nonomuraea glycinis]|uniref:hypothetical protein n=1 Tax=Nonomuraea glycinis TaxID=2047744 RepID=UPI002E10047C|nr:hypothetical protein OHA68_32710 [Nonomuraea glycinis]